LHKLDGGDLPPNATKPVRQSKQDIAGIDIDPSDLILPTFLLMDCLVSLSSMTLKILEVSSSVTLELARLGQFIRGWKYLESRKKFVISRYIFRKCL
jgi:hypothetical protein